MPPRRIRTAICGMATRSPNGKRRRRSWLHRNLVFERAPDLELEIVEGGRHAHLVIARSRQIDGKAAFCVTWPLGHHEDAVGEIDRLVDLMRDEEHRLARILPDA